MTSSPYLGDGWREAVATEQRRARVRDARPTRDPFEGWTPPSARGGEVTLAEAPEVVSEKPDIERDGATLVTYDDGSVWRVYTEFDPGTERAEMRFERVE